MEEKLVKRLESAVARLEALSIGSTSSSGLFDAGGDSGPVDASIVAFEDMMGQYLGRASTAAENIGGQVLDATKIVREAFSVLKELLIKVKQTQVFYRFLTTFVFRIIGCLFRMYIILFWLTFLW